MPEYSTIYQDAVKRIQASYSSCSKAEQSLLLQILQEMSISGYSYTLENLWLSDFKEIPVSIDQFLCDPLYLGSTNREGRGVYDFWKVTLNDIFSHGNKYNEIILSGATRIGKTSTMVTILCYMLYKLMLYRNPHEYFKKKSVSRFSIAFANLTKELAEGVSYREFNDTLKQSPWFNEHGRFSRSDRNFYYIPEGDQIDIVAGSDAANFLGMQTWCLIGDTQLVTSDGVKSIAECCDTTQEIFQYSKDGTISTCSVPIRQTGLVTETIRIVLEDGSVVEGTPDHLVMLSDGSYKKLGDLTSSDDLLTLNIVEVDDLNFLDEEAGLMNLNNPNARFLVYMHISPNSKRYIGITSKTTKERWLSGGKGYKGNAHFWDAIQKYGWDNFQHIVVAENLSLVEACDLEVKLIAQYDTMNPNKGYNHTTGGNWSKPDAETRKKLSLSIRRSRENPEVVAKIVASLKGHPVSEETRYKLSQANKGRKHSLEFCLKQRARKHSPETLEKLKGHSSWCKGLTKETDERLKRISEHMKSRPISEEQRKNLSAARKAQYANGYCPRWINNGEIETSIQVNDPLPEGFTFGRLSVLDTYIYKGEQSKKISSSELDKYLSDGWKKGRPANVGNSIRSALQLMHWEYDGHVFNTANELASYLNENGYPKIVGSTITSLCIKGFDTSPTYSSLAGKIVKVLHEDKIHSTN